MEKHHIQNQLKNLKLSAMVSQLEMRLLKAQQKGLDYLSFLSILLTDENECLEQRKVGRLTSSRDLSNWLDVFPDPIIGGAILDRLAHSAHQITLKGESIRKNLRLNNSPKSQLEKNNESP